MFWGVSAITNELAKICKKLRIGDLSQLASQVTFLDENQFLTDILKLALANRETQRIERLIKQAKFPVVKTFEGYKFHPITWPKGYSEEELLSMEFIENKQNILCLGAVGTGKTHLATALGVKASTMGKKVRFFRLSDLAVELTQKHRTGHLSKMIKQLQRLDLLILDEIGYIPCDRLSSQLLFNVISNCYEQQSIIITSNLQLGRWNEMFGDDRLTVALIDRLIHRAHILSFTGPSLRYEEAIKNKHLNN